MAQILTRHEDGSEQLQARTFGIDDAGKVIDEEGQSYFDDPTVVEIVIRK